MYNIVSYKQRNVNIDRDCFRLQFIKDMQKSNKQDELYKNLGAELAEIMLSQKQDLSIDLTKYYEAQLLIEWIPHDTFLEMMNEYVESKILEKYGWESVKPEWQNRLVPCEGANHQCSFLCKYYREGECGNGYFKT